MKKTISLIELECHVEVLYNLLQVLKDTDYSCNVFVSQKIAKELNIFHTEDNITFYINRSKKNTPFLKTHLEKLRDSDLIIVNTPIKPIYFIAKYSLNTKLAIIIHNVNFTFSSLTQYSIKNLFRNIYKFNVYILKRFFIKNEKRFLNKALKKSDLLLFPDFPIKNYAEKIASKKFNHVQFDVLPFTFYTEQQKELNEINEKPVRIIIPGTINTHKKDYKSLLEALKMIRNELNFKTEFIFLGKLADSKALDMMKQFKNNENNQLSIKYYKNRVIQEEFNKEIQKADFFVLPINIRVNGNLSGEYYGISKISGSINDMIKFGIPAIITDNYPLNKDLEMISEYYNSEKDLAYKLKKWINEKRYIGMRKKANEVLQKYNKEAFIETINSFVETS
jgi:glycosyltransferase involved in cell wall biosynthesis